MLNRLNTGFQRLNIGSMRRNLIDVVTPGNLSRLTLTRTQTSSLSTSLSTDNSTWVEYAANTARYNGSSRRLLIGGARTNLVPNPRTPFGTGWTNTNISSVTAIDGPDGVTGSAARINEGTATGTHLGITANFSATSGLSYAYAGIFRAGTCSFVQLNTSLGTFGNQAFANFNLSNGTLGTAGTSVTRHIIRSLGNGWYWCEMVVPATATAVAISSGVFMTESASASRSPSYTGTNRTLDVFWVWSEQAFFSSMPILPVAGSPATSTRGADLVSASLSSLGISPSGAGTYLWSGVIPQNAPTGLPQWIMQLDSGSDLNRFYVRNNGGGAAITAGRTIAGAGADATAAGSMAAGTAFRLGISVDGAGRISSSLDGGAATATTSGPTSGLTTIRLGSVSGGTSNMFGETGYFRYLTVPVSDGELRSLVAAMPV